MYGRSPCEFRKSLCAGDITRAMRPSSSELKRQFDRAVKSGWLSLIQAAANRYQFTPELLLAIGSRETNLDSKYQQVPGDRGHGFSMWQLDIGSHRSWIATGAWKDVGAAVMKAGEALNAKRAEVKMNLSGRVVSNTDLERITVAAYNCGSGPAVTNYKRSGNPDRGTTGGDYSADVLYRRDVFVGLIERQSPFGRLDIPLPKRLNAEPTSLPDRPSLISRLQENEQIQDSGKTVFTKLGLRLWLAITSVLTGAWEALKRGDPTALLVAGIFIVIAAVIIYYERNRLKVVIEWMRSKL